MVTWGCAIISFICLFALHFYFILYNHLVLNSRQTLFEFSVDKQDWKQYEKSLFILTFLSYYQLNLQEILYTRTNLRRFTKTSTYNQEQKFLKLPSFLIGFSHHSHKHRIPLSWLSFAKKVVWYSRCYINLILWYQIS